MEKKESFSFILNQREVACDRLKGEVLVDIIRKQYRQLGTTVACREGDCGACTVLVGELEDNKVKYRSLTSCISPWIHSSAKHVVTVEGITPSSTEWNPIQKAFSDFGATQCGYCTPGFVISIIGFFLNAETLSLEEARENIDGNICRCTGYKSIERAIGSLVLAYKDSIEKEGSRIHALVKYGFLPRYFLQIPQQLQELDHKLEVKEDNLEDNLGEKSRIIVSGGSDLWVQKPDDMVQEPFSHWQKSKRKPKIREEQGRIFVDKACRVEDFKASSIVQKYIPNISEFLRLFASTQIRNQASLMGNIVNASPIGDLTSLLLVLDCTLHTKTRDQEREIPLKNFYKAYKQYDLQAGEWIDELSFPQPKAQSFINFEKISRRTLLDIASVNSSAHLEIEDKKLLHASFSAGGVGPTPLLLQDISEPLLGGELDATSIRKAVNLALREVNPISDVRGTKKYKLLALRQLLYGHFLRALPDLSMEALVQ